MGLQYPRSSPAQYSEQVGSNLRDETILRASLHVAVPEVRCTIFTGRSLLTFKTNHFKHVPN